MTINFLMNQIKKKRQKSKNKNGNYLKQHFAL